MKRFTWGFLCMMLGAFVFASINPEKAEAGLIKNETLHSRADGVNVYGCRIYDEIEKIYPDWITIASSDPSNITSIVSGMDYSICAGAYVDKEFNQNGKVYVYRYLSGPTPIDFGYLDYNTGSFTEIADYGHMTYIFNDMSYDYSTETMYAIVSDPSPFIVTIDIETGAVTEGADLQEGLTTMSIDFKGQMWGIADDGSLVKIDKNTGNITTIGLTGISPFYLQSMEFDHSTGQLYWAMTNVAGEGKLMQINTTTGEALNLGKFGGNAQVTALSIPFVKPDGPLAVTNFSIIPGGNGALTATLSWTNPTENFDGTPAIITKVEVYRDDAIVQTINTPTTTSSWEDTSIPESGFHTYKIIPFSSKGEGIAISKTIYIGVDLPGAPSNVMLVAEGNSGIITWEEPTLGINGGWFDFNSLTYTITRYPDEVELVTGVTGLKYTDETISQLGEYSYKVTAVNNAGVGGSSNSNGLIVGNAFSIPYTMGFEPDEQYNLWAFIDANQDNKTWSLMYFGGNKGAYCARYAYSASVAADDWLLSPKIHLEAGKGYKVRFFAKQQSDNRPEKLAFYMMSEPSTSGAIQLWSNETLSTSYEEFTVIISNKPEGDYYFAFQAYSDPDMYYLFVDDFSIDETASIDAAAEGFTGTLAPMVGKEFTYNVNIKNEGYTVLSSYTVQLLDENDNVFATNSLGGDIAPTEIRMVEFKYTPTSVGEMTMRARVVADGDAIADNNVSEPFTITVQATNDIYDAIIGQSSSLNTEIPFNFYYKSSFAQSIYYGFEIGLPGVITELSYHYNFASNIVDKPVKIWMANTSASALNTWLPQEEFTLVYDGTINIPSGENSLNIELDNFFIYEGQNLVIMTERLPDTQFFTDNDQFFITDTPQLPNRTRHYAADSPAFDWTQAGSRSSAHPNINLKITIVGGSLSGIVTDGVAPLQDAEITIVGKKLSCTTDETGKYSISLLPAGDYDFEASKYGYASQVKSATITKDENTVVNFSITPLSTNTISGKIIDISNGLPIVGAKVALTGYDSIEVLTDALGVYSMTGIYGGADLEYELKASAKGFISQTEMIVIDSDIIKDFELHEINYPVSSVIATVNEADDISTINWAVPSPDDFRNDSGMNNGQLGFGYTASEGVFGSAFRHNAIIHEVSWFTTDDTGPRNFINLFIFALNENGTPTSTILYSEMNIPNIDMEWTTFELPEPVEAPNGFMLALNYPPGFLALGTSEPTDEYPFENNTHFSSGNYSSNEFIPVESYGYPRILMLRAKGIDLGRLDYAKTNILAESFVERTELMYIPRANLFDSGMPLYKSTNPRAVFDYSVYRLLKGEEQQDEWDLIGKTSELTLTDNNWATLSRGIYQYAVVANYHEYASIPRFSNDLFKSMFAEYTVNITTNSGDAVNGAIVKLTNKDGVVDHQYSAIADNTTVVFPNVWKGIYDLSITLGGFAPHILTDISIEENATHNAHLIEIIIEPYSLNIEKTDTSGNVVFSWNNTPDAIFDDFESYDDFIIENIGDYTLIDGDGNETYPFGGISYPNTGYTGSYMVFNPSATNPVLDADYAQAYSGDKYIACFSAKTPPNNDWLILPKRMVKSGAEFKFLAKTYMDYGLERIKIGVSTTGTNQEDFAFIQEGNYIEVPVDTWTEYSFDLNEYAGQEVHVAINCVSNDAFFLMIDDIFIGNDNAKQTRSLTGYTIYLNGEEKASGIQDTQYEFSDLTKGTYTAGVKSVYSTSSSEIVTIDFEIDGVGFDSIHPESLLVYPNPFKDEIFISESVSVKTVRIMDVSGQTVKIVSTIGNSIPVSELEAGSYLISIEKTSGETVVRKLIKK